MSNSGISVGESHGGNAAACGSDEDINIRDSRAALSVEEMVSEEEARRRREQLNRRPSYRMILKDLETFGDKPMKRELEDGCSPSSAGGDDSTPNDRSISMQQLPDSSTDSPTFSANGTVIPPPPPQMVGGIKLPSAAVLSRLSGISQSAAVANASATNPIAHLSPPSQPHLTLGQLNLIAPQGPQGRLIADIPSQPQPQLSSSAAQQPLLAAVNNLDMLGLKAPENLSAAFSQNAADWQNNLLSNYNRNAAAQQQHQQQQPPPSHLMQQNSVQGGPAMAGMNNLSAVGPSGANPMVAQHQHAGGPQHGLGNRQASGSLSSFEPIITCRSDNDETSRKRQVRLLKNREAAKECRRKKKEYVKCLENRVAVLENQNKALIEELKTLKELYCRKEQVGDQL